MQETIPLKLRHISIKDYKGIDHLELDFPAPDLSGDPDVIVLGSENGQGKTSVLECCALQLFIVALADPPPKKKKIHTGTNFYDLLVRAGASKATLEATFNREHKVTLDIDKERIVYRYGNRENEVALVYDESAEPKDSDIIRELYGCFSNPVFEKYLMFFHSYRKIVEGNPRFGALLNGKQPSNGNNTDSLTSIFKRTALFSMMSNAGLFDGPKDPNAQETLDKLDYLLKLYADCRFTKLRPMGNDGIELRVQPVTGSESFNFDGLSSGQKEIITTLFLIWYETRNQPKIVLIDEPELHLNSQWHRSFINSLIELAPDNQYIIATHSATVMDSVDRSRRILLQKEAVQ